VTDVTYSSAPASASVTLNTDGTVTTGGSAPDVNTTWLNYASSGAGSSYWVRATSLGGSGSGSQIGTTGSWLQLSSARSWEAETSTPDTSQSWALSFEFATAVSGTPIVGISRVSLSATSNSGVEP
jgi:hypothetical protein